MGFRGPERDTAKRFLIKARGRGAHPGETDTRGRANPERVLHETAVCATLSGLALGRHTQPRVTLRGFAAPLTPGYDVSSLRDGPMPVHGHFRVSGIRPVLQEG